MSAQKIVTVSVSTNSKKKVPDKALNIALVTCLSSTHRENHLGTDGFTKSTEQLKPDLSTPAVLLCGKDSDREIRVLFFFNFASVAAVYCLII